MLTFSCSLIASLLVSQELGLLFASASAVPRLDLTSRNDLGASSFYAPLKQKKSSSTHSLAKRWHKSGRQEGVELVRSDLVSANWWVDVQIGNQTFEFLVDSGGGDTWVLRDGFVCTNGTDVQPQSYCNSGPYYKGGFSGGQIMDENFNGKAGSGEFLSGQVGYQAITVANITIPNVEMALIDRAYWPAGSTGMLGLRPAVPRSVYNGTNITADSVGDPAHGRVNYNNFMETAVADGLIAPMFTLALGRPGYDNESYIAFGECLPPVVEHGRFVHTPMLIDPLFSATEISDYNVAIDAFSYHGYTNTTSGLNHTAFVDSGTISINAPTDIADAYSKLYDPPAIYVDDLEVYVTKCDVKPPKCPLHITIAGERFTVRGEDLVLPQTVMSANGAAPGSQYADYCFSGMQRAGAFGETDTLLGRPFMENVVVVHDLGANKMRFAQRKY